MAYFIFIIRLLRTGPSFFKLSNKKKAFFLKKCGLSFFAGTLFYKEGYYIQAVDCFKHASKYRHLVYAYEKLGLTSDALETAYNNNLYVEGAKIAMLHNDLKKAAYFYYHFDTIKALHIYKKLNLFDCLGYCYLKLNRPKQAFESFSKCTDSAAKQQGLRHVEEAAIILYMRKRFKEARTIFLLLGDCFSANECSKHLNDFNFSPFEIVT
ncbi:MAG: hypothetical protein ACRCSG_09460 [Cellulosilyticaceae bacterium]